MQSVYAARKSVQDGQPIAGTICTSNALLSVRIAGYPMPLVEMWSLNFLNLAQFILESLVKSVFAIIAR